MHRRAREAESVLAELCGERQGPPPHPPFPEDHAYEESAQLGERLLGQALASLGSSARSITEADWERLLKELSATTRQEVLAELGLGKQLAVVIARKLLPAGAESKPGHAGPVIIRGSEGMALQFAKCCHPIPGDPIIGFHQDRPRHDHPHARLPR